MNKFLNDAEKRIKNLSIKSIGKEGDKIIDCGCSTYSEQCKTCILNRDTFENHFNNPKLNFNIQQSPCVTRFLYIKDVLKKSKLEEILRK